MSAHFNKIGDPCSEEECVECNPQCECGHEVKKEGDLCGDCIWMMDK